MFFFLLFLPYYPLLNMYIFFFLQRYQVSDINESRSYRKLCILFVCTFFFEQSLRIKLFETKCILINVCNPFSPMGLTDECFNIKRFMYTRSIVVRKQRPKARVWSGKLLFSGEERGDCLVSHITCTLFPRNYYYSIHSNPALSRSITSVKVNIWPDGTDVKYPSHLPSHIGTRLTYIQVWPPEPRLLGGKGAKEGNCPGVANVWGWK